MRLRLSPRAIAALLLALFAVANAGAYRGFFSADDLDNLAWTSFVHAREFGAGLIDPHLSPHNFRPVGHFFFYALGRFAGLHFWVYVLVLQLLHVFNSFLLYRLLRRLGLEEQPALVGAFFFAFHMALFDAFWKPMYIFDVVCGTFCLASLLLWMGKRWLLSLLCFWLAYKSKEVAIGLPAVLLLYEFTLGGRRWKWLIPFFAISLSFGVQAILAPQADNDYKLRFTLQALAACFGFYGDRVLLLPYAGLLLVAIAVWLRERIAAWAFVSALALAAPLLFLPGRLFSVYLYVPMIAIAALIAAAARRTPPAVIGLVLLGWIAIDYRTLRRNMRDYLPHSQEAREYVEQVGQFLEAHPSLKRVGYENGPPGMEHWGVEGALHWLSRNPLLETKAVGSEDLAPGSARIRWDSQERRLAAVIGPPVESNLPDLAGGWYPSEQGFRWTNSHAVATATQLEGENSFRLRLMMPAVQLAQSKSVRVSVTAGGKSLGEKTISSDGLHLLSWPVPPGTGPVRIEILSNPVFRPPNDGRTLGIAVIDFGFSKECTKPDCL